MEKGIILMNVIEILFLVFLGYVNFPMMKELIEEFKDCINEIRDNIKYGRF